LNNAQIKRLEPFLARIGNKSKLFLYLLADGYKADEIRKLTGKDLKKIIGNESTPSLVADIFSDYAEEISDLNNYAFLNPGERKYSVSDIINVLKRALISQKTQVKGAEEFRSYIKKGQG